MPIDQIVFNSTTASSLVPFTLVQAKQHTRIDLSNDDDIVIPTLMSAAVTAVEMYINRKLISQQWDIYWRNERSYPGTRLKLPFRNVLSVDLLEAQVFGTTSPVQFTGANDFATYGDEIIIMTGFPFLFLADPNPSINPFSSGFFDNTTDSAFNALTRYHARATFGYGADSTFVPADLISATLELFANYYDHRPGDAPDAQYKAEASTSGIPVQVQAKLRPYRQIAI